MPRTIIDIPSSQLRDLDALCKTHGISRAEAVRRAVDEFLRTTTSVDSEGFGLWKGKMRKATDTDPARSGMW
jgi:metal-responsive CopG/Arc/MetJ family transcriptional regulator